MIENVHRRPASARGPGDDRVPEKYLGNQSELVAAWPGGDPDAPGAKGWIHVEHPLDGPPKVGGFLHGLNSVHQLNRLIKKSSTRFRKGQRNILHFLVEVKKKPDLVLKRNVRVELSRIAPLRRGARGVQARARERTRGRRGGDGN